MTPDCSRCDSARSLQPIGAPDTFGNRWFYCSCCSVRLLIAKDGRVLRTER